MKREAGTRFGGMFGVRSYLRVRGRLKSLRMIDKRLMAEVVSLGSGSQGRGEVEEGPAGGGYGLGEVFEGHAF